MATPNKDTLFDWYRQMVLIRRFEERCAELYQQGKIGGFLHLYIGQEATGVGAVAAMRENDHIITAYRDHGIALAKGLDVNAVMAEMLGKQNGVSGGKGGSMHLANRDKHFWGGYAVVGGHLPLAAGIALKSKYLEQDEVTICLMGDGATNIGYFHESLNLSSVWDLPVVWIIENNQYGMGTAVERASGQPDLVKRAIAYGMKEGPVVDGMEIMDVYEAVSEAVDYASQHGPVLMVSRTYRFEGHSMGDPERYRSRDEVQHYQDEDPIGRFRNFLIKKYKNAEDGLHEIEQEVIETIEEAVQHAEESPAPDLDDLVRHVYVD